MSEFLKFAYEILSNVVYNIAAVIAAIIKLFITGWVDYFGIFRTYFGSLDIVGKILSVILMILLVGIFVGLIVLIIRRWVLRYNLNKDKTDSAALYREIGRLNKQVLEVMEEKNKILALKVNAMGGAERIPYVGASALTEDGIPTVGSVTGGAGGAGIPGMGGSLNPDDIEKAAEVNAEVKAKQEAKEKNAAIRFPKLSLVDQKYIDYVYPQFDNEIALADFAEGFRQYAASKLGLYYTPEIVRRFVAGMAASKLLILEGISGTGKTSLPYAFSRYLDNPATIISVQPSYRDRTELLGYFNEFSKRFNETEFLRAVYESNYRIDPNMIVLDEMNLARIEYYFAEILSVLEMPNEDEWVMDLVPTAWPGDPNLLDGGKISVPGRLWFIGTANNDDSTFTITDKVYDRAIPIELNERAEAFEGKETEALHITSDYLFVLFQKAKVDNPISEETWDKMQKLDQYLQTRFKLAFGNRILKQMTEFIPVYVACGGTEIGGLDYIICRKVLKKFESMNIAFVRDEIKGLMSYIDKTVGKGEMPDSISYLTRIQNLY